MCLTERENIHKPLNVDFPRAGRTTFTLEPKLFFNKYITLIARDTRHPPEAWQKHIVGAKANHACICSPCTNRVFRFILESGL